MFFVVGWKSRETREESFMGLAGNHSNELKNTLNSDSPSEDKIQGIFFGECKCAFESFKKIVNTWQE